MDWGILDKLESFWKRIKEWEVLGHILKIKDMLCHPRMFWREYEQFPIKDKIIQFFTYAALFALVIWLVAYDTLTVSDLAKIITMEVASLFVYMVIIALANMIVGKEWKKLWFFVVFCCYTKFICIIPQLLALKAYYEKETPLLIGIAAFIPVVTELIVLVYPAYIRQLTRRKIVCAVLLAIVFLNVYDSFFIVTGFPRAYNSNYENAIVRERFELGKSIKNAYDIPSYVVTRDFSSDVWLLYSNPTDTVASLKFDDKNQFFTELAEDMDSLKAISTRCRFRTNKLFFDEMFQLKRGIKYVYETKLYESNPISIYKDIKLDSASSYRIYYRVFNTDIIEKNYELFERDFKDAEQFNKAFSSCHIGALWHPVYFIWSTYNNDY